MWSASSYRAPAVAEKHIYMLPVYVLVQIRRDLAIYRLGKFTPSPG